MTRCIIDLLFARCSPYGTMLYLRCCLLNRMLIVVFVVVVVVVLGGGGGIRHELLK